MKKLYILIIALFLFGCNAGSTTPDQQNNITINPGPVIVSPLPVPVIPVHPIESVVVIPPIESLEIIPPIESLVIIPPMESLIMRKTYFKGYYPGGCRVNNQESGIVGTCQCIQDPVTKDIWLASPTMIPDSWVITNALVKNLNASNTCGLNQGWHLPTREQLEQLNIPLVDIAIGDKAAWLNNNGFKNIRNVLYFGTMSSPPYAYSIYMYNGNISNTVDTSNTKAWGLAVNSSLEKN